MVLRKFGLVWLPLRLSTTRLTVTSIILDSYQAVTSIILDSCQAHCLRFLGFPDQQLLY